MDEERNSTFCLFFYSAPNRRAWLRVMGENGGLKGSGWGVKGDGGKRRFERGRLRTRATRESEADGLVGWLRPRMKGDVGKLWG